MKFKSYWTAVVWAVVIFGLHIMPTDRIPKPPDWSLSPDKLVHVFLFAGLSFLMLRHKHLQMGNINRNAILIVIISTSIYGLLMESVQLAVPGREFNLVDLVADGLGAVFGCFAYTGLRKAK